MKDGDVAGFSAFNGDAGVLAISKENGKKYLTMSEQMVSLDDQSKAVTGMKKEEKARIEWNQDVVYLRIDGDFRPGKDIATFYYSTDGKEWTKIGSDFKMRFDYRRFFMGTKYAIFNYATQETGGYVDVDYFDYKRIKNEE